MSSTSHERELRNIQDLADSIELPQGQWRVERLPDNRGVEVSLELTLRSSTRFPWGQPQEQTKRMLELLAQQVRNMPHV